MKSGNVVSSPRCITANEEMTRKGKIGSEGSNRWDTECNFSVKYQSNHLKLD